MEILTVWPLVALSLVKVEYLSWEVASGKDDSFSTRLPYSVT